MTSKSLTVACVQTNSGGDMDANLAAALVRAARAAGAELIALPENVALMSQRAEVIRAHAAAPDAHPAVIAFQALAAETGAWLLVGSLPLRGASGGRVANRSLLLDDGGRIVASYDKIHLFDVDLPNRESYRESATFEAGKRACLAPTPWGPLGMTLCYDLRFPQLFRSLAQAGAGLIAVPSAFTKVTGAAHWHVLLRARAIETGCFIVAPAQCGAHDDDRHRATATPSSSTPGARFSPTRGKTPAISRRRSI